MRKVAIGIAAAIALATVAPASAQGIWIGVPGFEIGIGTGPTYAYGDPYYGGYRYGPTYASEGYAYEPGYEYEFLCLRTERCGFLRTWSDLWL